MYGEGRFFMTVTAEEVNVLREKTGLPVMACKAALTEAGGDQERAEVLLRLRLKEKMDRKSEVVVPEETGLADARLFDLEWERAHLERELAALMRRLQPIRDELARRYGRTA